MANQTATTIGGKKLAGEIYDFIKSNSEAMKKDGANREAPKNEEQGNKDLANAIAFAVEKVIGSMLITMPTSKAITVPIVATPYPVTKGAIDLSLASSKYVFK